MKILSNLAVLLVALFHIAVLVLEMFFWNHPVGQQVFGMTPDEAAASEVLAMNQGLYNGFLAAGLFWGLVKAKFDFKVFFLLCVIVAGVFGGLTAKTSIIVTQGLPAIIALVLVVLVNKRADT